MLLVIDGIRLDSVPLGWFKDGAKLRKLMKLMKLWNSMKLQVFVKE